MISRIPIFTNIRPSNLSFGRINPVQQSFIEGLLYFLIFQGEGTSFVFGIAQMRVEDSISQTPNFLKLALPDFIFDLKPPIFIGFII